MSAENCINWLPIIISIISACIALISAIIAFYNSRSARKSYYLNKSIFESGKPNFDILDVLDCFLIDDRESDKIRYTFFLLLANLSDKATSVVKICLRVRLINTDIFFNADDSTDEPINIQQRGSARYAVNFSLPRKIYDENSIISYALVAYDIYRHECVKTVIHVREELINYEIKT